MSQKQVWLKKMIKLGIDGDLIRWKKSFLTNRKVQLVIDGHNNKERDIFFSSCFVSICNPVGYDRPEPLYVQKI